MGLSSSHISSDKKIISYQIPASNIFTNIIEKAGIAKRYDDLET